MGQILLTINYMADITALASGALIHQGQLIYDGGLDQLLSFAPYREVQLELAHPMSEAELLSTTKVKRWKVNQYVFVCNVRRLPAQ